MTETIYTIITKKGTKIHPYPLLYKNENDIWTAKNQISSYELISKLVVDINGIDNKTLISSINNKVYVNPKLYGSYANNNSWSPVLTENQLLNFITLLYIKLNGKTPIMNTGIISLKPLTI